MQYQLSQYIYLSLATFAFVGALTPLMRKLAIRIGAVDAPNLARKAQTEPVPYLGGVAIVLGVLIASYIPIYLEGSDFVLASTVLIPALFMGIMGLIDDLKNLPPWPRLNSQTLVGVIVAGILISTDTIGTPQRYLSLMRLSPRFGLLVFVIASTSLTI